MSTKGMVFGIQTINDIKDRCRVDEETGCWIWTGAFSDRRTPTVSIPPGVLREKRYTMSAIRAAFLLAGRRLIGTQVVYRVPSCPTPHCCNPNHHKAGTTAEANRAAAERGAYDTVQRTVWLQKIRLRQAIPIEKVRAIEEHIAAGNTAKSASDTFGVCVDTCREIRRGRHFHQRPLECKNSSVFSWGGS
jgi:hypothetical protein